MTLSKIIVTVLLGVILSTQSSMAHEAGSVTDLAQVYQQALDNSPQYKADFYTMKSAQAGEDISLGALFPNLSLDAIAQQTYGQSGDVGGSYRTYSTGVTLTQVLFDYNLYKTYQAARQSSLQAGETYDAEKQQFILDVATAYFNVLNAKVQLSFARANLNAVKSTLEQSRLKAKVGMATEVDVKVSEANYYSALAELKSDENAVQSADYALYQYTGTKTENLAALKQGLAFTNPYPASIDQWIEKGELNNRSLKAEVYAQNAAEQTLGAVTGAFLPTVTLEATYNVNDYVGNSAIMSSFAFSGSLTTTPGNVKTGYIGLTFTWNILNGGTDFATKKQAAYDYENAAFSMLDLKRTVKQQIQSDFYNVLSTVKQIESLRQSVIASQSAYEQYQARFKVGSATITDVLSQLQQLYNNKSLLATAVYAYINNVLQLKLDAGTLSAKDIQTFNTWLAH